MQEARCPHGWRASVWGGPDPTTLGVGVAHEQVSRGLTPARLCLSARNYVKDELGGETLRQE